MSSSTQRARSCTRRFEERKDDSPSPVNSRLQYNTPTRGRQRSASRPPQLTGAPELPDGQLRARTSLPVQARYSSSAEEQISSPTHRRARSQGPPKSILKTSDSYLPRDERSWAYTPRIRPYRVQCSGPKQYDSSQYTTASTAVNVKLGPQTHINAKQLTPLKFQNEQTMPSRVSRANASASRSAADIYNLPTEESEARKANPKLESKPAALEKDSNSSSSSSSDESSSGDESESEVTTKKSTVPPSAQPVTTKARMPASSPDSDSESSEDEDSSESESEAESTNAKDATNGTDETSSSEEESSDEESDSAAGTQRNANSTAVSKAATQPGITTHTANEPAPTVIGGVFKLQQPKSLGQIARVFESAEKEGSKLWVLTHSSSTPLNLEIQKVVPATGQHASAIVSSNAKITVPRLKDGDSYHLISSCQSINIIQTTDDSIDASFETPDAPESAKSSKPAPKQPVGLRARFQPIGIESRGSPKLGTDATPSSTPATEKSSKKEKKQKKAKQDKSSDVAQPTQLTERPKKKRKVTPPPEADAPASSQLQSANEELEALRARIATLEQEKGDKQAEENSSKKTKKDKKEKKNKSKSKDKLEEASEPVQETPRSKNKVKFADEEYDDDTTRQPQTPIPPPAIIGPSKAEADTKKAKRRRSAESGEVSEVKKKRTKSISEPPAPSSEGTPTYVKKVTPVPAPYVAGMP
ncbi:hypothetical protein jhhlp_002967 [Lomentospora prolificans]|uniref:Uncharacterized protein n=1 Tax=Lomentospora prolificans TaxID=41688 RepID=A0A2N3NFE7_9PEZI|nr:hypothetical protein jhhlp_002967 [Lomentospora prolificans]